MRLPKCKSLSTTSTDLPKSVRYGLSEETELKHINFDLTGLNNGIYHAILLINLNYLTQPTKRWRNKSKTIGKAECTCKSAAYVISQT